MDMEREEILQHWGVKGMKWKEDKKKQEQDAMDNARSFDARKKLEAYKDGAVDRAKQNQLSIKYNKQVETANNNVNRGSTFARRMQTEFKREAVIDKAKPNIIRKAETISKALNKAIYHNPKAEAKKTYDANKKKLTVTNEYEKKRLRETTNYAQKESAVKDINDKNNKVKQVSKKIVNAIGKVRKQISGIKKEKSGPVITVSSQRIAVPTKKKKSGRQK